MLDVIYNENCLSSMAGMGDGIIDMVLTSPPYDNLRTYESYDFKFREVSNEIMRVLKYGGVVVWIVGDATIKGSETGTSFEQALYFRDIGFRIHDTMIYKTHKPPMNDRRYQACFEYMFILSKGAPKTFNPIMVPCKHAGKVNTSRVYFNRDGSKKKMSKPGTYNPTKVKESVWEYSSGNDKSGHPAAFPLRLAEDHVISWSNVGDIVYDPFMGSGTTALAALRHGRHFLGSEISSKYCQLAEERIRGLDVSQG